VAEVAGRPIEGQDAAVLARGRVGGARRSLNVEFRIRVIYRLISPLAIAHATEALQTPAS